MNRRHFLLATGSAGCALLGAGNVGASSWPSDTVKLIVPFAAGGGTDRLARLVAQRLTERTGKSVVTDNKPGAGGNIGAAQVAKSASANELLFTTAAIAVGPYLYANPGFNLASDLRPVVQVSSSPLVLVVKSDASIRTIADLSASASKRPQGLNYGSPGIGTTSHLGGFTLCEQQKMKGTHVAYRGAGPVTNALLSGEIDFALMAAVAVAPFVKTQQLRAIAIAGSEPLPGFGNVALLGKLSPPLVMDNWQGVFTSSRVDPAIAALINRAINEVLQLADVKASVAADGAAPVGGTSSAFKNLIESDGARFREIVRAAGIKPE
jgi:tripartite-type tricarboxylate transporter receptor subunit TctC